MKNDELGLFIENDRTGFAPGSTLELTALWALSATPASLEARLFWYTRGKGTEDVEVVATEKISAPAAAGEARLRFALPVAPWSFSGKLVSLVWAVELVAEPGARSTRCEFFLSPDGREILLHA